MSCVCQLLNKRIYDDDELTVGQLTETEVRFADGTFVDNVDTIICATGRFQRRHLWSSSPRPTQPGNRFEVSKMSTETYT